MWKILHAISTGEQHLAAHRPCQDRWTVRETENRLILAVADGHGGSAYCRSAMGAQYACDSAAEVLMKEDIRWEEAARLIKETFDRKVYDDLLANPVTADEQKLINGFAPQIAYGTTLICAAVTPGGIYRCQVGDGEQHALNADGRFLPSLPEDPNCVGFFTSSLISPHAAAQARWSFDTEPAAAITLYTDGYVPHAPRPWKLLELAQQMPDSIPSDILEDGQRGDDQTVLLAYDTDRTQAPVFAEGLSRQKEKVRLEHAGEDILRKLECADVMIRHYIRRLSKCTEAESRNILIEKLAARQALYLTLCEKYAAIKDKLRGVSGVPACPEEENSTTGCPDPTGDGEQTSLS